MITDSFSDVCELFSDLAMPDTHRLPEFVIDNAQFRHFLDDYTLKDRLRRKSPVGA